jgi:hypothetical protein
MDRTQNYGGVLERKRRGLGKRIPSIIYSRVGREASNKRPDCLSSERKSEGEVPS